MSDQDKDPVVGSSLSKPLFIWSALLLLSLGWALYDEVYGIRPWKSYEARFAKLYTRYLRGISVVPLTASPDAGATHHVGDFEGRCDTCNTRQPMAS